MTELRAQGGVQVVMELQEQIQRLNVTLQEKDALILAFQVLPASALSV